MQRPAASQSTRAHAQSRILFHGPFGSDQSKRARDAASAAADADARDILYVVANSTARSAVISELVSRKGAVFGLRVVTITQLPAEIERRARVREVPTATGVVDDVLVERAIRTASAMAGSPNTVTGLAAAAAATITVLEHGGGTPSLLAQTIEGSRSRGEGPRILLDTWKELQRLRGHRVRSAAAAQRSAIELLRTRGNAILDECSLIVLEDLPLSGPLDRELMSMLLETAGCPVIATSEYARQLPLGPAMRSYDLLRSLAEWAAHECVRIDDPLSGAGGRLFDVRAEKHDIPATRLGITRLEAAGETGEARLAARVVIRHLRQSSDANVERPIRPADILIVARGSHYRALIREIFAESGIGVNATAQLSVAETALGAVLLELLDLAGDPANNTRDRALALLRTPHLDMRPIAVDRLERQVLRLGYLELEGWDALALRTLGKHATNRVNRLKRAVERMRQSFSSAEANQEMARAVRQLAKELRLVGNAYFARRRLENDGGCDVFESRLADTSIRDDNQTWGLIDAILDDTMPELLRANGSGARTTHTSFSARWLSLFKRAMEAESQRRRFGGEDLVRLSGAANGDGQPARVTIILGLRQQQFPRQPRQNPFLRDSFRAELSQYGIETTLSEDMADRERESFARAIATPSESLYLSYSATDDAGKPTVASFFIEDLQRAAGQEHQFSLERLGVSDLVPEPEDATTRAELLGAVAHGIWQRLPATIEAEANRSASFSAWNELLATEMDSASRVAISGGRVVAPQPGFDQATFRHSPRAPHVTLELSASQLNMIQHCTYQHFVEQVLRPATLVVPEYDALTKGSLVHGAMEQWVRLDGWHRREAALGELDQWFAERAANLPPAARESALARFTIEEDRARLTAFVRGELDVIGTAGAAQPAYNELAFGERAVRHGKRDPASLANTFDLPVATSLGMRTVKFTGSIDRVDVYESNGVTRGIALDYKTGKDSHFHSEAMLNGADLQLRLYLLALEELWKIKPAGALYIGFGDGVRRGVVSEEAASHIGEFDPECVTVMPVEAWDRFVHADTQVLIGALIQRLVTFDIVARPENGDCGFCNLEPICRYSSYHPTAADV